MKNPDANAAAIEKRICLERLVVHHDAEGDSPLKVGDEPFRWSMVQALAESILNSIYDLNVAIWLLRAQIIQNGLSGMRDGLSTIAELLRKPPEELHPSSYEEGEPPAHAHALVLGWLGGDAFLSLLRVTPIDLKYPPRLGDVLQSAGAMAELPSTSKSFACKMLVESREFLVEIREKILGSGAQWGRDPVVAAEMISDCHRLLSGISLANAVPESRDRPASEDKDLPSVGVSQGAQLRSRSDVKFALSQLEQYYSDIEPAHPAPILINRLRKMVDASFEEILRELYVDAPVLISRISNPVGHI